MESCEVVKIEGEKKGKEVEEMEETGKRKGECKSEIIKSKCLVTDTCVSCEVVKVEGRGRWGRNGGKMRKREGECKSEL